MSVEKALYLYEEFGLVLIRDGDKRTFTTELENKRSRCFGRTNDFLQ